MGFGTRQLNDIYDVLQGLPGQGGFNGEPGKPGTSVSVHMYKALPIILCDW